jgi:hypothetical protein
MNTSLILSENELHGLIKLQGDNISASLQKLIQEICLNTCDTDDVISTLGEKRLARLDGQSLVLEPLLKLIISEACAATAYYKPSQGLFALECPDMHLLFTRYEWAKNMWRIAPYQDKKRLLLSLD